MKSVSLWLYLCSFLVFCIILLGGYTRLCHAGLSIVEWKPITGIIPPLSEELWLREFQKYSLTPEFIKINYNFTLMDFKKIYWIEYSHRILGRLIGVVLFFPLLVVTIMRSIGNKDLKKLWMVFALVLFQGFIGWYMVSSGLVLNPDVSHYRLATHLVIATVIFGSLLYIALTLGKEGKPISYIGLYFIIFLLIIQIFFGGLVAGLDGGMIYNNFPLMNEHFLPDEKLSTVYDLVDTIGWVQFVHRINAIILLPLSIATIYKINNCEPHAKNSVRFFVFVLLSQIILGIFTLLYQVPLLLGLLHQGAAFILFAAAIYLLYSVRYATYIRGTNEH